jgi:hypothetical protein
MIEEDILEELNREIENIHKNALIGKISLLDFELVPIFNRLKDSINIYNLNNYSKTYKDACALLDEKFKELKNLLSSLDSEKKFLQYLKANPSDLEIYQLFNGCWREIFNVDTLSMNYLEQCQERLCKSRYAKFSIEHMDKVRTDKEFILKIPKLKFTEKMNKFFINIQEKLPCSFDEIFEGEKDQIVIYENFIYILHLLQLDKIKYQKETNILYK